MIKTYYKSNGVYLEDIPYKDKGVLISKTEDKEEWYIWDFNKDIISIPFNICKKVIEEANEPHIIYSFLYYLWNKFNISLYPISDEYPPGLHNIIITTRPSYSSALYIINTLHYRFTKQQQGKNKLDRNEAVEHVRTLLRELPTSLCPRWGGLEFGSIENNRLTIFLPFNIRTEEENVLLEYLSFNKYFTIKKMTKPPFYQQADMWERRPTGPNISFAYRETTINYAVPNISEENIARFLRSVRNNNNNES